MTDNRERAIAEVAEEIGWTTEQVSYCTYSVMCMAVSQVEQKLDLLDALKDIISLSKDWGRNPTYYTQPEANIIGFAEDAIAKAERKG